MGTRLPFSEGTLWARFVHCLGRSTMFHATISDDDRKPFCLSGRVTPYDLEVLRDHVMARLRNGLRVEVRLAAALRPLVERVLRDFARRGVVVDVVEP